MSDLVQPVPANGAIRPRFAADSGFHADLKRRVAAYLEVQGAGGDQHEVFLTLKALGILMALGVTYGVLVFAPVTMWQACGLALLCGVLAALVGFNIQHDGGHKAFSRRPWRNRVAAASLDLIGASSYLWHWKHAVFHHGYANVSGHDTDISVGSLVRLEPHQQRLAHHRWQHVYIWLLYGLMAVRWQLYDDLREVVNGAIGPHRIPRPRGWAMAWFVVGKAVFVGLVLVLPMWFHPVWAVLLLYGLASYALGTVLALVFQLAHNTAVCDFPLPSAADGRMDRSWAEHQVATTADFARGSRWATWLLGGLNFQVEHHLFPQLSHLHYPALSGIVEATCRDHGVAFREHPSLWSGLVAHFRWLRNLGLAPAATSSSAPH